MFLDFTRFLPYLSPCISRRSPTEIHPRAFSCASPSARRARSSTAHWPISLTGQNTLLLGYDLCLKVISLRPPSARRVFELPVPCLMAMSRPCSGWLALLGWIDSWVQSSPENVILD